MNFKKKAIIKFYNLKKIFYLVNIFFQILKKKMLIKIKLNMPSLFSLVAYDVFLIFNHY